MKATHEDLSGLIRLQQTDLDALKQKKALDELPQRKTILNARQKRAVVEEKLARVAELRKEAESRLTRIEVEDGSLAEKADGVQAAIAEAQGDYRNVEARTKELDGIAKRRETLEEDRARAKADLAKIEDVETQVALTLEEISKSENAAVESFKKEGGALKEGLAQLEAVRADIVAGMSPEIVKLYEKTAARAGGVAVGVLTENRCGVCRMPIDGGRLIDLKAQAPLGVCPSCKRLLLIG